MRIKLAMELIFSGIENGGGTFTRRGVEVTKESFPAGAFVVGGRCPGLEIPLPRESSIIAETEKVAEWADSCKSSMYFGSWVEDGVLYLDAVDICYSRELAIDFAINRGQKAIYDLVTGKTIYV